MKYTLEQLAREYTKDELEQAAKLIKSNTVNALGQISSPEAGVYINTNHYMNFNIRYGETFNDKQDWCVFETQEQAQAFDNRQIAIKRCWDWAKINDDFEPDWKYKGQDKHYVRYDHEHDIICLSSCLTLQLQADLPHFSSEQKAKQFKEQCKEDILLVLRITK